MTDDLEYQHHLKREQQERALAEAATNPAVAAVHLEMAKRHAELGAKTPTSGGLANNAPPFGAAGTSASTAH